ncbi:uncharacterized protein BO95DRAFT_235330 [Aspergillus brunneoviolaceus CBS 621.78]|uniref:Uncharacterized protein n=1 Tax=Aspergillus brunneoviolaceus CBS 621.78 TaxID=1450534 RepID=A0ACD1FZL2_9EURO|nr:hypothetical protein BO95DRAFT_235330 [Aspergillus brunneoviolaceus CBS 621.78]RAH42415.1 hypothetical protein BO95DRAFT_235330 [Aspergillus brunneoviolaceus CBS 621.78]
MASVLSNIQVWNMHASQGAERPIVILGLVVTTSLGIFLEMKFNRSNIALGRAEVSILHHRQRRRNEAVC